MQIISSGTVISDRFVVEALMNEGNLGQIFRAHDQKANAKVALRIIPKELLQDTDIETIRTRLQLASALTHKNIRASFGMGIGDGYVFIAGEWIDGHNLRTLLEKRAQAGKRFSFKGAYNIIGHVCNALTFSHEAGTWHGALNPRAIIVNKAGRVKLHDFPLSAVRISNADYAKKAGDETSFWAPEVIKDPNTVSFRSDIYSLGALFYNLITGRLPARPLRAPSKLGFSKELDSVIARCMSADPKQRFLSAKEVKQAIAQLAQNQEVAKEPAFAVDDDLGIDIDVEFNSSEQEVIAFQPVNKESVPQGALGMLDAPDLPKPVNQNQSGDARVSVIDMGAILANSTQSDVARWMVQKDKFDHGPFCDRELIQMILLGEVQGNHKLTNMDTGERKKVRAWGQFDDYLEHYRLKKKQMDEQAALVRTEKAETRGMFFKVVLVLGIIGVVGLGIGGYFLSRQLRSERQLGPEEMVAALDSGEIQIKMGSGAVSQKAPRKGGQPRKGGAGGGRRQVDGGLTYEEAMNMGISLGDLKSSGGRVLTASDINAIMSRNVRMFLPCMSGESVKRVDMNIAISGDGQVIGVSVQQGSPKMQSCVASKVRSIKFPSSNQARTATNWYFELY